MWKRYGQNDYELNAWLWDFYSQNEDIILRQECFCADELKACFSCLFIHACFCRRPVRVLFSPFFRVRIFSSAEYLRRVLRLIWRTMDSGDDFFLVLMHFSSNGFIIRKPSLKKNHEWSEFSWTETICFLISYFFSSDDSGDFGGVSVKPSCWYKPSLSMFCQCPFNLPSTTW